MRAFYNQNEDDDDHAQVALHGYYSTEASTKVMTNGKKHDSDKPKISTKHKKEKSSMVTEVRRSLRRK